MASDWPTVPLGQLIEPGRVLTYGVVQPGPPDSGGVPIVRVADVRDGRVSTSGGLRISPEIEAPYGRSRLRGGELLLTVVGTVGETVVAPDALAGWNRARGVAVIPVRKDVGSMWVRLALQGPEARRAIDSRLNTTVQATLNLDDVARLPIPMPSAEERQRILRHIGALDDKIELNRRMSQTLESMARALFKSWFVDFDPVRAKSEGRDPGLPPHLADLFPNAFESSELGEIPTGWRDGHLRDVLAELVSGARPRGGAVRDGVPSIGAENVIGLGCYDFSREKFVPRAFFEQLKLRGAAVRHGDVLLYKDGAGIGRKTYFEGDFPHSECAINEHVFILRARSREWQRFLFFWLDQDLLTHDIVSLNSNSAQPGINQPGVRGLRVLVPDDSAIGAFDQLVAPLTGRLFANCRESRTLAASRDVLLPKLISGELRLGGVA